MYEKLQGQTVVQFFMELLSALNSDSFRDDETVFFIFQRHDKLQGVYFIFKTKVYKLSYFKLPQLESKTI